MLHFTHFLWMLLFSGNYPNLDHLVIGGRCFPIC
jgi:hypothetical protein